MSARAEGGINPPRSHRHRRGTFGRVSLEHLHTWQHWIREAWDRRSEENLTVTILNKNNVHTDGGNPLKSVLFQEIDIEKIVGQSINHPHRSRVTVTNDVFSVEFELVFYENIGVKYFSQPEEGNIFYCKVSHNRNPNLETDFVVKTLSVSDTHYIDKNHDGDFKASEYGHHPKWPITRVRKDANTGTDASSFHPPLQ